MNLDQLLLFIEHYGYAALFFALWLGIVGLPIPDEVIVMTGGMVSSFHILQLIPAFIVTYLGVISGLSIGYLLGRTVGAPVLHRIARKKKAARYIEKSQHFLDKYGNYALVFSYFFPFVRHIVPYLVGINKMSFRRYALFSFTTGAVWTLLFFVLGYLFGHHIDWISETVYRYGWLLLIIFVCGLLVWWAVVYRRKMV